MNSEFLSPAVSIFLFIGPLQGFGFAVVHDFCVDQLGIMLGPTKEFISNEYI